MEVHTEKTDMKTLSSCMNKLQSDGYDANFMVAEGKLKLIDSEKVYDADEVRISNFYRFEGETDPSDMSILYVIETTDGMKGLISDAYGVYADPDISGFINAVEEIMKKTHPSKAE